jgi:hypothetical protein
MRHLICAAAVVCLVTPAAALDLPARKVGLWEIKTTAEDTNRQPQVAQHCIDAETDKQMSALGSDMGKEMCSKQDVQKVGATYVIDSVCKFGPISSTSQSVVSGDFNSAYTVKMTSKREGGPNIPGMPAGGTSNLTIEAKWLGACAADQKPGDIIMAGGRKINVRDMQNMMKSLPKNLPKNLQDLLPKQ